MKRHRWILQKTRILTSLDSKMAVYRIGKVTARIYRLRADGIAQRSPEPLLWVYRNLSEHGRFPERRMKVLNEDKY